MKIIIEVSGGIVQAVYSTQDNIEIDIIDYDEAEYEEAFKDKVKELQTEAGKMFQVL